MFLNLYHIPFYFCSSFLFAQMVAFKMHFFFNHCLLNHAYYFLIITTENKKVVRGGIVLLKSFPIHSDTPD